MNRADNTATAPSESVLVVYVTCADDAVASRMAQTLVDERHAACVSIVPQVQSTYRWQGSVETATESLLVIKTRAGRLEDVRTTVTTMHPDDVPELIAVAVHDGTPQYLDWVLAETR